jgi:flavin reductase (DIM6/NTAB) family NADH-FMN oxidoreductase RutF
MLFCPAKASTTWPTIRAAGYFCINVMSARSSELVRELADKRSNRFKNLRIKDQPTGPALEDAVAWIECEIVEEHDAGDHTIVVAHVLTIRAGSQPDEPLVFSRGRYGQFQAAGTLSDDVSPGARVATFRTDGG